MIEALPVSAHEMTLHSDMEDGSPVMRIELQDASGGTFADFTMNFQTAEAVCITLALWSRQHSPGQTAPTSTTLQ